tara:strand:+ start:39 stop:455 length:417 start_codon:yes stop_codon:yes gene_type:complete
MTNTQYDTQNELQSMCDSIAQGLQDGEQREFCPDCGNQDWDNDCCEDYKLCQGDGNFIVEIKSGYDYLNDALDIQYIVNSDRTYRAARILVACGGPNIWIDTLHQEVQGYWASDKAISHYYTDKMDIDGACQELWECK